MRLRPSLLATLLFGSVLFPSGVANAQAVAYTAPASKLGGAIATGITQTLIRRGFAANDPRILSTITAVGVRVLPLASAAGSGATWLTLASRLSLWLTAGVLVYSGIRWYFDLNGNVVTKTDAQSVTSPGTMQGAACYWIMGASNQCFGTPQEAFVYYETTSTVYTDFVSITLNPEASNTTAYANGMRYSASGVGHRSDSSQTSTYTSSTAYVYIGTASMNCPAGQGIVSGACVDSRLSKYNPQTTSSSAQTYQQAYNALPQAAQTAQMMPDLVAEQANRYWKDAASQPDYNGVPFDVSNPVTGIDLAPHQQAHPSDWPVTSELVSTVPTSPTPIKSPYSDPNQVTAPSTATKIDLGPDPGTPAPTLDAPPTDIFKPIKDGLQPWLSWQVPAHSSQSPTWSASPSIAGHVFNIDLSYHCTFAEQYRSAITAAMLACWIVIAAFIILSA
jgi:hypothetical protein